MREKIRQLLIELRLKGMQNVLDPELDAAEKKGTAIQKVLYRLLCEELIRSCIVQGIRSIDFLGDTNVVRLKMLQILAWAYWT